MPSANVRPEKLKVPMNYKSVLPHFFFDIFHFFNQNFANSELFKHSAGWKNSQHCLKFRYHKEAKELNKYPTFFEAN